MNQKKLLDYLKRWRELESRQRDLDIEKSRWCRDLRGEFVEGAAGDHAFLNWLETELGMPHGMGETCLERAAAMRIVPDAKTWERVGGFRRIRPLISLGKRDQVAVLEVAKLKQKAITTVIREHGLRPKSDHVPDAVRLSEFIVSLGVQIPDDLEQIIVKHTRRRVANAA